MEELIRPILDELSEKAPALLVAAGVLAVALVAGHLIGLGIARVASRGSASPRTMRLARQIPRWGFVLFGVLLALQILGYTALATSVLATGGVAAVVFGFAFREIGENMLAGIFLAFSRSFDVGDLIESGGLRGVVRSIELRATHIRTGDGCDIFIPSAQIYRQPLHNFTRDGLRRASFTIGVDYGDDPERALEIVRTSVEGTPGVLTTPAPGVELAEFAGSWMELRAHLWVDIKDASGADTGLARTRSRAMSAARGALLEAGFTLSSDTTTALAVPPLDVRLERGASPER